MLTDRLQKTTPVWKFAVTAPNTTVAIWTPRTSTRILLTGLDISGFGANTSTLAVFFSTSTATRGTTVGYYSVNGTSFITPRFSGLAGDPDVPLNIFSTNSAVSVTVFGAEQ